LEEAEGVSYLVLEYVPGRRLGEMIGAGGLDLKDALSIALQIADALAAAHDNGVIHRDLKPDNVRITPQDQIKVLDFGLAKAVGDQARQQSTITEPGRVLGTPAYMSPEQVRGKEADRRSDIWSFGCILFEMLAGRIPFDGDTVCDMLAAVLEHEPRWESLPHDVPANIRVLLRRCLNKDPRRRLQHIGDAAIEISETLNLPASAPPDTTRSPAVSMPLNSWRWPATVVSLALVAIAAALAAWHLKPSAQPRRLARRFTVYPETAFEVEALWHHAMALSPDGKNLAYVEQGSDGRRKIYLRGLDEFEATPLPGTEGAISPFFSPDGEWIGYADHFQRKIKKIPVKGGEPIVLAESMNFRGASWATDDTIIFAPTFRAGLWRICASGEGPEQLTVPDANAGETGHGWPQVLPGGKQVLFTNFRSGGPDEYQIEVYSFVKHERCVLFKGGSYARYVPTGHVVYGRNETLYAVDLDIERLKVAGPHIPVVPGVVTPPSRSAQFAVSDDGTLAYVPVQARSTELMPVWVDRQGKVEPVPAATPRNYNNARISSDGSRIAFDIQDGASRDIWIYDVNHATLSPLTSDGGSSFPIWGPADESVLFASYRSQRLQIFRQSVAGGEPQLLTTLAETAGIPMSRSGDGTEMLVTWSDPNHPLWDGDLWVTPLRGQDRLPWPFIQRNHNQRHGIWSPDGEWVAYASDESGRWEVYVEPYPSPGAKTMISTEGGHQPLWSRDGTELFYRSGDKMMAAAIRTGPTFEVSSIEELFERRFLTRINYRSYDVTSKGKFLMIQEPQEPARLGISVVLNWFEELKQIAPAETD
jgi:Tol biopolymer transport system component